MRNYFVIERIEPFASQSRNTRGEIAHIRFNNLADHPRPDLALTTLIEQLLDRVLTGRPAPLRVGLQVQPPNFHHPFTVPLRPVEQNNAAALAAAIERLNEISQAGIDLLSGTTTTKVVAVWPLTGQRTNNPAAQSGSHVPTGSCDLDQEHSVSSRCRSIVRVHNPNDRYCLARAVVIGLTKIRLVDQGDANNGPAHFRAFCQQQEQHLLFVNYLMNTAGLPYGLQEYSLEHAAILQRWLNQYYGEGHIRIVVFQKEQQYRIVFKGDGRAARYNLCLLLENNHYNYIGRPEQLLGVKRYCIDCERSVTRWSHWAGCRVVCRFCMRTGPDFPCQEEERIPCQNCGFVFPRRSCYDYHLINSAPNEMIRRDARTFASICQMRRICNNCHHIILAQQHHDCQQQQQRHQHQIICKICNGPHTEEQPCFIQPLKAEEDEEDDITENNNEQQPHQQQQQQQRARKHRRPIRLCFFDAETSQDDPVHISQNINGYRHVPLLIIAEVICEACIRAGINIEDVEQRAQGCFCGNPRGQRWRNWCSPPFRNAPGDNTAFPNNITFNHRRMFFHSFDNAEDNPVDQFLDYLLNHGSQNMLTICIAHNGGKYDFHLLLEALHRRSHPPTRLCTTGLKIYSMSLGGYHQRKVLFKDSLNYFFCELDALPKVFDLPEELATSKPFFPYLYIQRQHLHQRIRGLPAIQYYQPEYKKAEKREKLIEWYVQQTSVQTTTNFQLREQLIIYCVNDVAILRESVLRFRQLIGENTKNLDPFLTVSTAAGLALTTMRRCFLPENWLVHSPEGGYLRGRRASAESQRYIRFFELQNPESAGQIQHAQWAIGEAHVEDCGYRLDGLWLRSPPLRPLAIEYMGCYYHGCPKCFPVRDQRLAAGRTAEELFERTQQRLWELEHQHGYQLHVVWGHEIKEKLINNTQLRRKWFEIDCVRPMDPREDCLRGGRTEPFKLHHMCVEDEEILYIDIVSLYPYVMKARSFPIGHPNVLTRDTLLLPPNNPLPWTSPEHNIYKGLLLVRVQPPNFMNGNLPPVLPYRTHDGRLTFPLCAKCADNRQQRPCTHGERERSWLTGYTHVELNYALERGYKVVDIYEVWNYEKWDPNLFRSYVNTFIGLKQQASGWPDGCASEMDRADYLAEFERVEGIFLDPEKIETNPGLRMIAKLLANSLWGKLAQRVCGTEVRYAKTPAEFHQLLEDSTIDMLDFDHVSEHLDRCVVRKKPEFAKAPNTNCLPVAAFVTSYARLHLYEYIEQVH
uniref:DNA-directed DNA polymerase n=2 Tax=Meloidogyne TaxID=189290 RepID=A0A914MVR5_MELIC